MDAAAQLELALKPAFRWGGSRPGAGRKPGNARHVPHASRPSFSRHHPSHVTLRVRPDVPSLRSGRLVRELERSLREAKERAGFRLIAYSVQRDHLHLLVEAENPRALGCGMKSIGARIARAVRRVFGGRGPVLKERYHQRAVRSPREVRNALSYVSLNARKHAAALGRELVRRVESVDLASSGRWFDGWSRALPPPADLPAVAAPRTWLLRVGWRRHGLIDPSEIPGSRRR
jgi:REP element-mobilizing transposase RayT